MGWYRSSRHETSTQCRFNVGPASMTLAQHRNSTVRTYTYLPVIFQWLNSHLSGQYQFYSGLDRSPFLWARSLFQWQIFMFVAKITISVAENTLLVTSFTCEMFSSSFVCVYDWAFMKLRIATLVFRSVMNKLLSWERKLNKLYIIQVHKLTNTSLIYGPDFCKTLLNILSQLSSLCVTHIEELVVLCIFNEWAIHVLSVTNIHKLFICISSHIDQLSTKLLYKYKYLFSP